MNQHKPVCQLAKATLINGGIMNEGANIELQARQISLCAHIDECVQHYPKCLYKV